MIRGVLAGSRWKLRRVFTVAVVLNGLWVLGGFGGAVCRGQAVGKSPEGLTRAAVRTLPDDRVAIDFRGSLQTMWHFGDAAPRPFFYPLMAPSGHSIVRMGHPGAPNHDHHRGVWFAHHDVNGHSFWSDSAGTRIRQKQWLAYQAEGDAALIAVRLGWFDPEGTELIEQDVIAQWQAGTAGNRTLEIQTTLRPAGEESVTLGKTNFGLLAVRVSADISEHFGGGRLTNSRGAEGEPAIFGKPAEWVDYSGEPLSWSEGDRPVARQEGITYFPHPTNPGFPHAWHVRADGWMTASLTFEQARALSRTSPLRLRYLLRVHAGAYDAAAAERSFKLWSERPAWSLRRSAQPHVAWEVQRDPKQADDGA